jgi:signal transduction histidine kinase/CheY-like chemotaxis protein
MNARVQQRYRTETRRLVARRGPLGALLFVGGVGIASALEAYYHPERLSIVLLFLGIELAICLATMACFRAPRLRRFGVALTSASCVALVLCVTVYGVLVGLSSVGLALLLIVFELSTALLFPWGARAQALLAAACTLSAVWVGVAGAGAGAGGTLPAAYELYAVAAGGLVSVMGAAFLDRQRFTVFAQREQLDRHLEIFRDLTRSFHGLDPQRVVFLTCTSMLQAFGLTRVWVAWLAPGSSEVQGYLVRARGADVVWEPLADVRSLWAWAEVWDDTALAVLTPGGVADLPALLRAACVESALCIPLGEKGERIGAICADREGERLVLGEREIALASVLASGAAIAMTNAWLYQQVAAASEEKSVFLARIAHELRNPLQAILWDTDMLREQGRTPEAQIERLRQNALLTLDVAKELQEFAEIETRRLVASLEPINLAQTLDHLQATALALVEGRPIEFRTHVAPGAEVLVTDPLRFRQILANLISNAAKFTARGAIELDARRAGGEIVIEVRDTGSGIDAGDLPHIFAPFYRGSTRAVTSARGMGLGLAIAQEIAALLGGRIEVRSAIGAGSTFALVLPAPAAPPATPEAPPEATVARGGVALLIEDDQRSRAEAAEILRQQGFEVIEASDGFEGLRRARARRPDVIVLDVGLPGLSGIDVLAHLRRDRQLACIPVVVATAETDAHVERQCREAGCAAFLRKPLAAGELLRAVALVTATAPSGEGGRHEAQARARHEGAS